ncbi:Uncharacterised protein [Amycolatopsis camponoti]|uniref:Uncharacterized protein n=1 Tax=Amycolatopsis camponoti TaxID=2606593 RepID=A0A6I8M4Z2_9PSEU|nr:hypothetical protein [Amycolatopsis camponoti]VVJ22740.1 Uncharacterised protein [Amycolatopsis camponoti]
MPILALLFMINDKLRQLPGVLAEVTQSSAVELLAYPTGIKFLLVLVLLLTAFIVALGTGCVLRLTHASWTKALVTGGSAGGATVGIGFLILGYLLA